MQLPVGVSRTSTCDRFASGARIGDYRIEEQLGSEETGVVYLATHVVLPRQVALKVMHAAGLGLRSMAVQMLREACLLEALSHPGIPRVYECGVLPDRRPWTAFQHVEGPTLADSIASAPLPIADLVVLVRDIADVLQHAHARGIVHRRITADAIVRTPDRAVSACVREWDDAHTLDTEAHVTLDARDDVHALGVIAYRALTGCLPDRAVSAADRNSAAPVELTSLIDHMLATEPTARPTSEEVRDRARWLAATVEQMALEKVRWTPPPGVIAEARTTTSDDATSGFSIRIAGRTTRSS